MSLNFDYQYLLDHYFNPRNYGVLGHPQAHAEDINPLCEDRIEMGIEINDERITTIRFQGRGCDISQAAASILTEMIQDQLVQEVSNLSEDDLLDALGIPISAGRSNCAFLSLRVLHLCLASAKTISSSDTLL
jgi:nitrogen fixation NifU-like protein